MLIKLYRNFYSSKDTLVVTALDPGQTLGVATALLGRLGPDTWEVKFHTACYRFPEDMKALADVELSVSDVIIVETWRLFGSKAKQLAGNDLPGPQCLGYIRGVLWATGEQDKL